MILKLILPKYLHFNGPKISGALEEFSITSRFFGSKIQTKLRVLIAFLIELKNR